MVPNIFRLYLPTIMVVLADQLSKIWIKNNFSIWESREILGSFVKFSHVKNPGIAFGISVGEWGILITFLSFIATLFIITSISLTIITQENAPTSSVLEQVEEEKDPTEPEIPKSD